MKLKTLKDIKCPCGDKNCNQLILTKKLKAEAVKWVKEEWEDYEKLVKPRDKLNLRSARAINDFIEHFFNIIEEDLK